MAGREPYELLGMGLNDDEKYFIKASNTHDTGLSNQTRVISEVYFSKRLEKTAARIIESNKKTADAQNKYAGALNLLTLGLVIFAAIQIVLIVLNGVGKI